jgi:hypothetical protein
MEPTLKLVLSPSNIVPTFPWTILPSPLTLPYRWLSSRVRGD